MGVPRGSVGVREDRFCHAARPGPAVVPGPFLFRQLPAQRPQRAAQVVGEGAGHAGTDRVLLPLSRNLATGVTRWMTAARRRSFPQLGSASMLASADLAP